MEKFKIGILLDNLKCTLHDHEILSCLANESKIEIYLLLNNNHKKKPICTFRDLSSKNGIFTAIDLLFFSLITSIERIIVKYLYQNELVTKYFFKKNIEEKRFQKKIILNLICSKTNVLDFNEIATYGEKDIQQILSLNLDLIINLSIRKILQREMLKSSKHGILSFYFCDDGINYIYPPGFWETLRKEPFTRFFICIMNGNLEENKVIFSGGIITQSIFFINQIKVYQYSKLFLQQILNEFINNGEFPKILPSNRFLTQIGRVPHLSISCEYMIKTWPKMAFGIFEKKILKREYNWSVAYTKTNWKTANLSLATNIENPNGRFFADPFVISRDNQVVIFVEDYSYSLERASISAIRLLNEGFYEIIQDVIKEDFHLSFPCIFEYNNDLYMIPESHQSNSIRLYKCQIFPEKWIYLYDLIQNVNAVDTVVFEYSGKWWLFSNILPHGPDDNYSQLFAFMADSPLSRNWQKHRKNPIVNSFENGRNGGILRDIHGEVYRVRQKHGFCQYGKGVSIAKIQNLDLDYYQEELYCDVEPNCFKKNSGTHHMNCNHEITVFDYFKKEKLFHEVNRKKS